MVLEKMRHTEISLFSGINPQEKAQKYNLFYFWFYKLFAQVQNADDKWLVKLWEGITN